MKKKTGDKIAECLFLAIVGLGSIGLVGFLTYEICKPFPPQPPAQCGLKYGDKVKFKGFYDKCYGIVYGRKSYFELETRVKCPETEYLVYDETWQEDMDCRGMIKK